MLGVNILVIEDDEYINNLLCSILQRNGYHTRSAYSGSEAELYLNMYEYQLVMLDLMLPGINGEQLISKIRKVKTMPIIVISARDTQDVKIEVLKLGADDFVTKPFDVEEILARAEAQLRRYMVFSGLNARVDKLTYKSLEMNLENRRVFLNNKEINLTVKEFSILELLIRYPDKVFTKANLFEHVWNDSYLGDDNTVNVHISNIRSKIAVADPDTEYIKTIWGIGFKII